VDVDVIVDVNGFFRQAGLKPQESTHVAPLVFRVHNERPKPSTSTTTCTSTSTSTWTITEEEIAQFCIEELSKSEAL
jgi:hypothetical protein